jgi:hypothetical protein
VRALVMLLPACATPVGPPAGADVRPVEQGVIEKEWIESTPMRMDVLFVLDSSPAMQPYQAQLAKEMHDAGLELGGPGDVDLHVGVITGDLGANENTASTPLPGECAGWGDAAALRRSPLVDDAFIEFREDARGERTNTRGSVVDALAALGDVGANGCAHQQPLEAMRIALDHDPHNAGFLRDNARLAVIFASAGDDASPHAVSDYTSFLTGLNRDVYVLVVGAASERLRAFQASFPNRGTFESIAALGVIEFMQTVYAAFFPFGPSRSDPCLEAPLLDTNDDLPGVQPDCVVEDRQQLIPRCGTTVQFPCWRIATDPQCVFFDHLRIDVMRGDFDPPDNNLVVAQCVAP